jgi:hypothetical protein
MGAAIGYIVELRPQLPCLVVEDSAVTARQEEVNPWSSRSLLMPEPQQFHEPRLYSPHAKGIDDLQNSESVVSVQGARRGDQWREKTEIR